MSVKLSDDSDLNRFIHDNNYDTISTPGIIIYLIISILVISGALAAGFIHIPITIQADGIIRPLNEKSYVKNIITERVIKVLKKEGDIVKAGETLMALSTEKLSIKADALIQNIDLKKTYLADLIKMNSQDGPIFPESQLCIREYSNFKSKLDELNSTLNKAKKEYDRNQSLFKNSIISEKDFDDFKYQYSMALNELNIYKTTKHAEWQNLISNLESELKQAENDLISLKKEQERYEIKAPINGTIEELKGIFTGTNLEAGQIVSVISPDSGMLAEVFVNPRDIGFIRKNYPVKVQVDAFNYNEWGMISGKIIDISDDYILINNMPCFRIRCSLNSFQLQLKNGVKGRLKKGMTIRARFVVTEKTILQLLYENIDNLLNPTQTNSP
jgi:membrane fusion protein, peptide pheromone/bacteriocin exporter